MEDAGEQGRLWFWRSVTRIWLSLLGRDLFFAPLTMAISSAIAWFLYMGLSLVLALAGYIVVTLGWGVAYVLTHHTGLELLTDVLRVRFDWPPIPDTATYVIQAVGVVRDRAISDRPRRRLVLARPRVEFRHRHAGRLDGDGCLRAVCRHRHQRASVDGAGDGDVRAARRPGRAQLARPQRSDGGNRKSAMLSSS